MSSFQLFTVFFTVFLTCVAGLRHKKTEDFLYPFDNVASSLRRCHTTVYPKRPTEFEEVMITNDFTYSHIFKSGGATIQNGIRSLYVEYTKSLQFIAFRHAYDLTDIDRSHIFNETLLFTYIRDPIDRFLSGFFELHRRNISFVKPDRPHRNSDGKVSIVPSNALHNLQWLIRTIQSNLKQHDVNTIYINSHIWPQLYFLMDSDGRGLPFDYIGRTENLDKTLPQLLQSLVSIRDYNSGQSQRLDTDTIGSHFKQYRNRRSISYGNQKWDISRQQLSAEDINILCQLYWMDYLCFPFTIPSECDIKALYQRHINTDFFFV